MSATSVDGFPSRFQVDIVLTHVIAVSIYLFKCAMSCIHRVLNTIRSIIYIAFVHSRKTRILFPSIVFCHLSKFRPDSCYALVMMQISERSMECPCRPFGLCSLPIGVDPCRSPTRHSRHCGGRSIQGYSSEIDSRIGPVTGTGIVDEALKT